MREGSSACCSDPKHLVDGQHGLVGHLGALVGRQARGLCRAAQRGRRGDAVRPRCRHRRPLGHRRHCGCEVRKPLVVQRLSFVHVPVAARRPGVSVSDRPGTCEVRLHVLGDEPARDELVHARTGDPKTFIAGWHSRDGRYHFVSIMRGWNENDLYFKRVGEGAAWQLLAKGVDATYGVEAWRTASMWSPTRVLPISRCSWSTRATSSARSGSCCCLRIPRPRARAFQSSGGTWLVSSLRQAASVVELFTLQGSKVREVELPGLGTASNLIGDEADDEAFFSFSSFVAPPQVFRTSVKTGHAELWSRVELPIDPSRFEVRQVSYPSKDGTAITMFIVASKGVVLDGENPLSTGVRLRGLQRQPAQRVYQLHLPLAGGGRRVCGAQPSWGRGDGKAWHDAGKQAKKQNVFDDFVAAAEYLVAQRWTRPERLAIRAGSNGGLLVGAVMTQRPELFGAVLCAVPLLDMVRYPLFGSGKTWVPEYGDPEQPEQLAVLLAYSPYHHVVAGRTYPPLLMVSADHDDRVDPMHARKFVAMVQQANPTRSAAWLRIAATRATAAPIRWPGPSRRQPTSWCFSSARLTFLLLEVEVTRSLG